MGQPKNINAFKNTVGCRRRNKKYNKRNNCVVSQNKSAVNQLKNKLHKKYNVHICVGVKK